MTGAMGRAVWVGLWAIFCAACSAGGDGGEPAKKYEYCLYALNSDVGILGYGINTETGALTALTGSPFATGRLPGGIAVDPSGRFAYVQDLADNNISAFAIKPSTGILAPLADSPFDTGEGPWDVGIEHSGRFLYVLNHYSWSVSVFAIAQATGALTDIGAVDTRPYPMDFTIDPLGRFIYMPDWDFNISGFAINAATGALTPLDGSPFWAGEVPVGPAIEPSGRFAYIQNIHNDGTRDISVYAIDAVTGALTVVPGSLLAVDLSLTFEPSGKFAYGANAADGTVSGFAIDAITGILTEVAGSPFYVGQEPESLAVDPTGKFLYVGDPSARTISVFSIDAVTGALTGMAGSPAAKALIDALTVVRIVQ